MASGSNDGKLLIWENGELKVTKQLFGRIEELKWVPDHKFLISAHFGGGGRSHGRIYAHILGVTAWTETETSFFSTPYHFYRNLSTSRVAARLVWVHIYYFTELLWLL